MCCRTDRQRVRPLFETLSQSQLSFIRSIFEKEDPTMNELKTNECTGASVENGHSENARSEKSQTYLPAFDAWQTDHSIVMTGDLPGVTADGLDVQFDDGTLSIHGRVEKRLADKKYWRSEYGMGDFHRTFRIAQDIDVDGITAKLDGGVVTIELPIAAKAQPRRIAVVQR
jgi:HSP20 family protein